MLSATTTFSISSGVAVASNPTPKASPSAKKKVAASKDKKTEKTEKTGKTGKTEKKVSKKQPVKKTTKKKVVKKKARKISRPIPSPSPKWPPKGFKEVDGVYISTPKSERELVGVLSAKTTLLSEIQACEKRVCAVIYVASETKCKWWEVQAIVIGKYADVLGNLRTLAKGTKAKERKTIILISKEPVEDYAEILNMKAFCRNDDALGKIPSNTFTPNPALAPVPTPVPSPVPSLVPSPVPSLATTTAGANAAG